MAFFDIVIPTPATGTTEIIDVAAQRAGITRNQAERLLGILQQVSFNNEQRLEHLVGQGGIYMEASADDFHEVE